MEGFSSGVKVLNYFPLKMEKFLPNLRVIEVTDAGLREITPDAINKLYDLELIDLSKNLLQTIAKDIFSKNYKLKFINLQGNPLTKIEIRLFTHQFPCEINFGLTADAFIETTEALPITNFMSSRQIKRSTIQYVMYASLAILTFTVIILSTCIIKMKKNARKVNQTSSRRQNTYKDRNFTSRGLQSQATIDQTHQNSTQSMKTIRTLPSAPLQTLPFPGNSSPDYDYPEFNHSVYSPPFNTKNVSNFDDSMSIYAEPDSGFSNDDLDVAYESVEYESVNDDCVVDVEAGEEI